MHIPGIAPIGNGGFITFGRGWNGIGGIFGGIPCGGTTPGIGGPPLIIGGPPIGGVVNIGGTPPPPGGISDIDIGA